MRMFFDMDGVLAKCNTEIKVEDLYVEGYFAGLEPQMNIIQAAQQMEDAEVYTLSAVLADHRTALAEKNAWLDRFAPFIDQAHRIFTVCGEKKTDYIPSFNAETDLLIDDYGKNCSDWLAQSAPYVKVSRDRKDAREEQKRHHLVISPDMNCSQIRQVLAEAV